VFYCNPQSPYIEEGGGGRGKRRGKGEEGRGKGRGKGRESFMLMESI